MYLSYHHPKVSYAFNPTEKAAIREPTTLWLPSVLLSFSLRRESTWLLGSAEPILFHRRDAAPFLN